MAAFTLLYFLAWLFFTIRHSEGTKEVRENRINSVREGFFIVNISQLMVFVVATAADYAKTKYFGDVEEGTEQADNHTTDSVVVDIHNPMHRL